MKTHEIYLNKDEICDPFYHGYSRRFITESGNIPLYKLLPSMWFGKYSPAYILTNENLRETIEFGNSIKNVAGGRVLTATGSGDHAIFYSMAGADAIDTFDISACAKIGMDIKIAAASVMSLEEYTDLLQKLYQAPNVLAVLNSYKTGSEIIAKIPADTRKFINDSDNVGDNLIFAKGLEPTDYKKYWPTPEEFSAMKQIANKPINFIWANLCHLHKHLESEYDVINLSNIFQYVTDKKSCAGILKNLDRYLAPDGMIISYGSFPSLSKQAAEKHFKNWKAERHLPKNSTIFKSAIFVLHRSK